MLCESNLKKNVACVLTLFVNFIKEESLDEDFWREVSDYNRAFSEGSDKYENLIQ